MRVRHLALTQFRSFAGFESDFDPGTTIIWGNNGAGKSNLIEALYLLATTRSPYTSTENDLVHWHCPHRPAFARVVGDVVGASRETKVELRIVETQRLAPPEVGSREGPDETYRPVAVRRQAIINGHAKPVGDLLGHLTAVHFSPEEVELVAGSAERRRRFLDIALSQIDRQYVRTLRRLQRVVVQRNALLRHLRDHPSLPSTQLDPWDTEVIALGGAILAARLRATARLNDGLARLDRYAPSDAPIRLTYQTSVSVPPLPAASPYRSGWVDADPFITEVTAALARAHRASASRDRASALTLIGPHRDDLVVRAGTVDQRTYGSRGQQRTAALAIKVAEAFLLREVSDDPPVLLFDDVMSELDPTRRSFVERMCSIADQAIVTGTEQTVFSDAFRSTNTTFILQDRQLVRPK